MATKEKFEEAKRLYETANADQRYVLESLFPELAESDDERIRKALIKFFALSDDNADHQCCGVHYKDIVAWLEKQEYKPIEWSEEDKAHIDSLLKRLEGMCKPDATFISTEFAISEDEDWLKSLRPQSQWKPSNEQMDALLVKIPIENSCNKVDNILKSLYSDLKKLK